MQSGPSLTPEPGRAGLRQELLAAPPAQPRFPPGVLQEIHVVASSWPATSYFLKRKDVPVVVASPGVAEVAKAVGKKPPQVGFRIPAAAAVHAGSMASPGVAEVGKVVGREPPQVGCRAPAAAPGCMLQPEMALRAPAAVSRCTACGLVLGLPCRAISVGIPMQQACGPSALQLAAAAQGSKPSIAQRGCATQVLVRYALDKGCSISPKATSHDHIKVGQPITCKRLGAAALLKCAGLIQSPAPGRRRLHALGGTRMGAGKHRAAG